jgi:hypothetical protein
MMMNITFLASMDKRACSVIALDKRNNRSYLIEEGDGYGLLERRFELDTIRGSGACASCVGGEGGVYGEAN